MPPNRPLNQLGQLHDVFLGSVSFARNFDFDLDADAGGLTYSVRVHISPDKIEHDEGDWGVDLHAKISWTHKDGLEDFEAPFELELSVIGVFAWLAQDLDEAEIADWLTYNSEHLLWPYLRAYIQQITAASDIPPLTIYTLGVPRSRPESKVDEPTTN